MPIKITSFSYTPYEYSYINCELKGPGFLGPLSIKKGNEMIEEIEEIMDESESTPNILSDVVLNAVLNRIGIALVVEDDHEYPNDVWITAGTNEYQEGVWFAAIRNCCGCIADIDICYAALRQINAELRNKYSEEFFESKGFKKPAPEPSNVAGFYIKRKEDEC